MAGLHLKLKTLAHQNRTIAIAQEAINPCLQTGAWGPRKVGVGEGLADKVGKGLAQGWTVSLQPPMLQFPKRPFRRGGL